jgi:hypothetical protein
VSNLPKPTQHPYLHGDSQAVCCARSHMQEVRAVCLAEDLSGSTGPAAQHGHISAVLDGATLLPPLVPRKDVPAPCAEPLVFAHVSDTVVADSP